MEKHARAICRSIIRFPTQTGTKMRDVDPAQLREHDPRSISISMRDGGGGERTLMILAR